MAGIPCRGRFNTERTVTSESIEKEDQCARRIGRIVQWYEASLFFAGGSWGAGSNPGGATSIFFSIVFLPFGLLLLILIADPF